MFKNQVYAHPPQRITPQVVERTKKKVMNVEKSHESSRVCPMF